MKRKDIAVIAVIVVISAVFSVLVSSFVFGGEKNRSEQVEVVDAISSSFEAPNKDYFNSNSINPTKLITIGENSNPTPFKANDR